MLHMKRLNQTESPIFLILCVLCFQRQSFLYFYFTISITVFVCPGEFFILNSRLANFWERNCPFGFLFVVFWLWCRCFKYVLLSLWWLGRRVLGHCIDSWSLPSFLLAWHSVGNRGCNASSEGQRSLWSACMRCAGSKFSLDVHAIL